MRVTVEQLEQARIQQRLPGVPIRSKDHEDFYLVALVGHNRVEQLLSPAFTPLQLFDSTDKCRFVVRRYSVDGHATDV